MLAALATGIVDAAIGVGGLINWVLFANRGCTALNPASLPVVIADEVEFVNKFAGVVVANIGVLPSDPVTSVRNTLGSTCTLSKSIPAGPPAGIAVARPFFPATIITVGFVRGFRKKLHAS